MPRKTKAPAPKGPEKLLERNEIPITAETPSITSERAPEGERRSIAWYEKDGKIQWDKMRKSTQEALREFLARPDVWKELEVARPEKPPRTIVGEPLVAQAYNLLGRFESFLAQRLTGCSQEQADKIMLFDEEEKAMLVPVTVRLINKRGPDWLAEWNEEIEFGIAFLSIQMGKMVALRVIVEREARRRRENVPPPTPILVPDAPPVDAAGQEIPVDDSVAPPVPAVVNIEEAEVNETT